MTSPETGVQVEEILAWGKQSEAIPLIVLKLPHCEILGMEQCNFSFQSDFFKDNHLRLKILSF